MAPSPKLSVLLPTYNYARYLPEAIGSVLAQDHPDFELIISDDASTDDSARIIREHAARDPRIRAVLHPSNLGMVANWNACLALARGEYVKFLFGDDLLASPSALSRLAALLEAHPKAQLAGSARLLLDGESRVTGVWNDLAPGLHDGPALAMRCLRRRRNLIGEPTSVMFRREAAQRGFDPAFRQIVDLEMWFHLLLKGPLAYTPEPLCAFRRHEGQQTAANNRVRATDREMILLLDRYAGAPALQRHLRPGGFSHRQILFRQWHYMRRAGAAGAPVDPEVMATLRAGLPGPWFFTCWLCHRLTRPAENLQRKLTTWGQTARLWLNLAASTRHPPAWRNFIRALPPEHSTAPEGLTRFMPSAATTGRPPV